MNIRYGQYLFFFNGMQINNRKKFLKYSLILFLIFFLLIYFIKYNEVKKKLTLSDNIYIELILSDFNIDKEIIFNDLEYKSKIQFIHDIQKQIVTNPNSNKMTHGCDLCVLSRERRESENLSRQGRERDVMAKIT